MLRSGRDYKMAEVTELIKAWMEKSRKQDERREEDRKRYEEERQIDKEKREDEHKRHEEERKRYEEEKLRYEEERRREAVLREENQRRYEEPRQIEREEERRTYESLVERMMTGKRKLEIGPDSLKLTKLGESEDIEAFLTTFESAVEAHGVEREKWALILAPQLTGRGQEAYAAMQNDDTKDYNKVKQAILQCYNINEETYRHRFRLVKPKEEETPVELVTRTR